MRLGKKEWRIIERALLKFTTTDDEDAPETDREINNLYIKVRNYRRERGLLMADEKRRTP